MSQQKTSFSIFLLRATIVDKVESKLFSNGRPLSGGLDGSFIYFRGRRLPPRWLNSVARYVDGVESLDIKMETPAGMMLIKRNGHTFIVTFGHSWQKLDNAWLELDFGRRVALNSVPPDKVVEVNSQQIFAKKHLARERAPRASSVREFAIEYDRDLVGSLEGIPAELLLGSTLRGSLSLRLSIDFSDLGKVLDRVGDLFISDSYKKKWPHIDTIVPLSHDNTIATLDAILDKEMISGKASTKAVLFTPAFIRGDITSVDGYAIGSHSAGSARSPYLLYSSWENYLAKKKIEPSISLAKKTRVHLFDESGEEIERRSVYDCLTYELSHENKQYILSSGIWNKADDNFVKTVNGQIGKIPPCPISLPSWNGTDAEGKYNMDCCSNKSLLHFDAKNINFGGGQSKFEFCDFMHLDKKVLFFVKIASKSSGCSHLVEQVRRTDELFFGLDASFRSKLKKAFEKHYPNVKRNWLDQKPIREEWKLCLVSLGRDKIHLPFFAKCSVWRLVRTMEQSGHTVFFASV